MAEILGVIRHKESQMGIRGQTTVSLLSGESECLISGGHDRPLICMGYTETGG
jgi:hypothetical protein